ncbi:MAG: c-type cytochrome [Acetobacteraceae bacterium]|nr:c-type cytochrome [Acetobacteraceae bacterium]
MIRAIVAALLLALPAAAPGARAQDGRAVFEANCAACHAAAPGAPPMAGPNLHGVVGRRVGTAEGFDYSPVLQEAGRAGDAWDAARLERFLADPEEMYPGLWMGGNGLRVAADRRAVVAFLQASR